jgi:hypothetical protein
VVFAGQAYLFCTMVEREVTECCCARSSESDGPRSAEGDVRELATCCHVNEHANPGSGTTPTSAHALDEASPIAPATSPLAILGRADGVRMEIPLPDWNGPPLEARAKLQVFLL